MGTITKTTTDVSRTKLAAFLPLRYTPVPKTFKVVRAAELLVNDLEPGDFVHAWAAGECSTQSGITVAMVGRYLKGTKTGSSSSTEGLNLSAAMTTNVSALEHHCTVCAAGSFVADADWSGTVKLIFVMYAASLGAADDPRSLILNYVELRADVTRTREVVDVA